MQRQAPECVRLGDAPSFDAFKLLTSLDPELPRSRVLALLNGCFRLEQITGRQQMDKRA